LGKIERLIIQYVSFFTNQKKEDNNKRKNEEGKREKMFLNFEKKEDEMKKKNRETLKKISNFEKKNKKQHENLKEKWSQSGEDYNERLNRVYQRQYSMGKLNSKISGEILHRQFDHALTAATLDNLYSLKKMSLNEKKIVHQILEEKKAHNYHRNLPKLQERNISLKKFRLSEKNIRRFEEKGNSR